MSDRTQDLKNLRAVATACKNYVDETKEQILWQVGQYNITTQDDNTTAYQKVVPTGATRCKIKRIYGLTQKLNPTTTSDSTSYSVKTMPATVYDFDISKVEGNSEKSENLIVLSDVAETTTNGVTYKVENGVIYLNGTASDRLQLYLNVSVPKGTISINYFNDFTLAGGKMGINFRDSSQNLLFYINSYANTNITQTNTISEDIAEIYINIVLGTTLSNISFKPMLVSGSTAPTEFKTGYTGIHNFAWTGVKVEGANLFDNDNTELINRTFSGANQNIYAYTGFRLKSISLIKGRTYTIASTKNMYLGFTDSLTNSGEFVVANSYTFTATTQYVLVTNHYADQYEEIFENLMLNYGSTALDYIPYITPTTTSIDLSTILYNGSPLFENNTLKGYGGVNDSVSPYKATKKIIGIPLKDLDFSASSTASSGIFRAVLTAYNVKYNTGDTPVNALIDSYEAMAFNPLSASDNMKFGIGLRSGTTLTISMINQSFIDNLNGFIASVQDKVLYAEMNSYIEVSINWASLLRGITGYSNGTISLLNTNNQDTANLITYNSIIKENCCAKMVQSRGGNVVATVNFPTQASDGYSAVSVANIRDFTTNKRETNVNKVDLGNGSYTAQYNAFYTYAFTGYAYQQGTVKFISAKYESFNYNGSLSNFVATDKSITFTSATMLWFTDKQYGTDVATAKTANSGNNLYYELADASKTSTDITPIENVIEVQPGDELAFYDANDNLVTVQSDLTYRIEVAN